LTPSLPSEAPIFRDAQRALLTSRVRDEAGKLREHPRRAGTKARPAPVMTMTRMAGSISTSSNARMITESSSLLSAFNLAGA
jgi:hypothetical protein